MASWLPFLGAVVAVAIAWKVLQGIVKTIALVAISVVAAMLVFGGV